MASESRLGIIIEAEDRATAQLKKVEGSLGNMQKKIKSLQPTFRKMALIGTATFGALAIGASKAITVSRDLEEETNKFNVVFKDVSEGARAMAKTLNESYGLSRLESKRLLSSTGDILTGFGFTGKAALDLSSKVNTLAVDLASFTNAQGGAEAVSSALTKALLGERESLKTYGIAIQEADIKAELLSRGMNNLTGEALRQAKTQITLDIAFRQSKNAIGDYERSTGTLKQTQVELAKTIEDTQAIIGNTLAPVLNDILKKLLPVIEKISNWVEENPKLTKVIILSSIALAGMVAVLGTIGLLLPGIIKSILLMKTAFVLANTKGIFQLANGLKGLSFVGTLSGIALVVGALVGLIVILNSTVKAFQALKQENELLRASEEKVSELIARVETRRDEAIEAGETERARRLQTTIDRANLPTPDDTAGGLLNVKDVGNAQSQSFNFDFRNSLVTDKESFIRDVSKTLSRNIGLAQQGVF